MAIGWLSIGWLVAVYQLAIGWLSAGYQWLHMGTNGHIYLHKDTQDQLLDSRLVTGPVMNKYSLKITVLV